MKIVKESLYTEITNGASMQQRSKNMFRLKILEIFSLKYGRQPLPYLNQK